MPSTSLWHRSVRSDNTASAAPLLRKPLPQPVSYLSTWSSESDGLAMPSTPLWHRRVESDKTASAHAKFPAQGDP